MDNPFLISVSSMKNEYLTNVKAPRQTEAENSNLLKPRVSTIEARSPFSSFLLWLNSHICIRAGADKLNKASLSWISFGHGIYVKGRCFLHFRITLLSPNTQSFIPLSPSFQNRELKRGGGGWVRLRRKKRELERWHVIKIIAIQLMGFPRLYQHLWKSSLLGWVSILIQHNNLFEWKTLGCWGIKSELIPFRCLIEAINRWLRSGRFYP